MALSDSKCFSDQGRKHQETVHSLGTRDVLEFRDVVKNAVDLSLSYEHYVLPEPEVLWRPGDIPLNFDIGEYTEDGWSGDRGARYIQLRAMGMVSCNDLHCITCRSCKPSIVLFWFRGRRRPAFPQKPSPTLIRQDRTFSLLWIRAVTISKLPESNWASAPRNSYRSSIKANMS